MVNTDIKDIPEGEIISFQEELLAWADRGNLREFPWRKTDDPYEVFIAEILLGATPATKAEDIYVRFIDSYPDLGVLARAEKDELATLLEPLGLHNRRASAFVNIAQELDGEGIPQTESELLGLPYVGPYTANATLCFGFGQRRAILDTNVIRVYEWAFGVELAQEDQDSWKFARTMLPENAIQTYNFALIDLGDLLVTSSPAEWDEEF